MNEPTYLSGAKGHNSTTTDGTASTLVSQEKDTPIVADRWQLEREIEADEDAEIERYELEEIEELEKWDKETNGGRLTHSTVRRLTPRETERLQGFPDDWSRWGVNEKGEVYELSDSARYTLQGNSIARPFWTWLLRRIAAEYEDDVTLGSLFDGQGGFPLCGLESGIKPLWASEIEKHAVAVTKYRFEEDEMITVIERKPVPIYRIECYECHSVLEYKAADVKWCHITCPVCGKTLSADVVDAVRYEETEEETE